MADIFHMEIIKESLIEVFLIFFRSSRIINRNEWNIIGGTAV